MTRSRHISCDSRSGVLAGIGGPTRAHSFAAGLSLAALVCAGTGGVELRGNDTEVLLETRSADQVLVARG